MPLFTGLSSSWTLWRVKCEFMTSKPPLYDGQISSLLGTFFKRHSLMSIFFLRELNLDAIFDELRHETSDAGEAIAFGRGVGTMGGDG